MRGIKFLPVLAIFSIVVILCLKNSTAEENNDFDMEILEPKIKICYPGDTNTFTAKVINNDNKVENFTIDIDKEKLPQGLPQGWAIEFEPKNFTLSWNESKEIDIRITTNDSSQGDYNIHFNMSSLDNLSAPPAKDFCTLIMKPFYKPEYAGTHTIYADTSNSIQYCYFYLRLKNAGLREDTVYGEIRQVESPLSAWWDGGSPYALLEHEKQSEVYSLKVMIPLRTTMGSYIIELYANSSNDPSSNNITRLKLIINRYVEFTPIFNEGNIKSVYIDENPNLEIELNVTNFGNADDEFEIKLNSSLRFGWNSNPTSTYEKIGVIPKDGTFQYLINIEIYENEIFGDYEVEFELRSVNKTNIKVSITLVVRVEKFYGIQLIYAEPTPRTVKPELGFEKVGIAIEVKNIGNTEDYFLLSIDNAFFETTPKAVEWIFDFYSDPQLYYKIGSIWVEVDSIETVYLGVEIPTKKDKRDSVIANLYSILIYGESQENKSKNTTVFIPLIINEVTEIDVEYIGGCKKAEPGEIITFIVNVTNYGNKNQEMNFNIIDGNEWSFPIDDIYKKEFEVGEKREIMVNISLPTIIEDNNAVAGYHDITLKVKPFGSETWQQVKLPFEIKETYGCEIEVIDEYKEETMPEFGTEIKFEFKVTNLGNSKTDNAIRIPAIDAVYNLSASDFNKWDVRFQSGGTSAKEELTLYIEPLDSEEVSLVIDTRPWGGFEDYYGIEIRAYPLGHLEDEATPVMIWLNFTEPIYKLQWTNSSQNQNKILEPEEGTKIEYTCYLENTGTEDDIVTLRVEPLDSDIKDWKVKFKTADGEEETTSYEITHGDKQTVTVVVYPAADADYDPLPYKIEIVAESELETTATDRLTILTTVKRPDIVILAKDIIVPQDVKEGDLAQITVKVSNEGNAKARNVTVQFFSDIDMSDELDLRIITIPANSSASVNGDWDVEAGKYHITVYADKKNDIREINEENNRATSSVTTDVRQDLVVSGIEINVKAVKGKTVTVFVTVWNNGSVDVRNIKCTLYQGSEKVGDVTITSITQGSSEIAEFKWKIPNEKGITYYNLKAEVPTTYLGQDDPTPGDNKERKTVEVEEAPETIIEKISNFDNLALILIPLIFTLISGFSYMNLRNEELAACLIVGILVFSFAVFWSILEKPIIGLCLAVIVTFLFFIPLNHDVKNYKRIRKQIVFQRRPVRRDLYDKIREQTESFPEGDIKEEEKERRRSDEK